MSSSTEVTRCLCQLDCTELHGQKIYDERDKNGPYKKEDKKFDKLSEKHNVFPKKQEAPPVTCDAAVALLHVVEPEGRQVQHLAGLHAATQRPSFPVLGVSVQVWVQGV
ncbi:hypothetical protein EYF80_002557 [Liparis tanakae]|uniref:Uncharacterized protein n=1 Tax=Liparis tanakae TaxID=230148 RepID=A0A4Z2JB04_9TELE|nr:hypothetical protein EYF80_002557 [Liparis tanakae]